MEKQNPTIQSLTPDSNIADMTRGMIEDFDQTVRSLSETRRSIEKDIASLRCECEKIKEDKAALEIDIGRAKELSDIVMAARVAEEEKEDTLKKNQELRAYLDSARDTIKEHRAKLAEADGEIKRVNTRIDLLEKEKLQLLKEREPFQVRMTKMNDMIKEQGLKIRELTMKLEASEEDKRSLRDQLDSTKKTLDGIQQSMASVRERMRSSTL